MLAHQHLQHGICHLSDQPSLQFMPLVQPLQFNFQLGPLLLVSSFPAQNFFTLLWVSPLCIPFSLSLHQVQFSPSILFRIYLSLYFAFVNECLCVTDFVFVCLKMLLDWYMTCHYVMIISFYYGYSYWCCVAYLLLI